MAVSLKRRRVSGQGAVALMGAAVPVGSLAEAHRSEIGTIIESLEVAVVHVGALRQAKQAGSVCDVLVADGSMYMAVTLLGCNVVALSVFVGLCSGRRLLRGGLVFLWLCVVLCWGDVEASLRAGFGESLPRRMVAVCRLS